MPQSEVQITRLTWNDQARALPRALYHAIRRVLRREARWYYVQDGRVIGRMVSTGDYQDLVDWIGASHRETFDTGREFGGRAYAAKYAGAEQPDAGDTRTA